RSPGQIPARALRLGAAARFLVYHIQPRDGRSADRQGAGPFDALDSRLATPSSRSRTNRKTARGHAVRAITSRTFASLAIYSCNLVGTMRRSEGQMDKPRNLVFGSTSGSSVTARGFFHP